MFRAMIVALTALVGFSLTGCGSLIRVHRLDVQQGNVITDGMLSRLHKGMSQQQVLNIFGQPVLNSLFIDNQLVYVYTWQPGYGKLSEKRLTITFQHGKVAHYEMVTKPKKAMAPKKSK